MALDRLTKVDGGGISTTSDYRVGIITASKFVGPFDGTGGNFSGVVTATNGVFSGNISAVDGNFSGNVTIGGTLTYEDVTNIDSVGIITAQKDIHVGAGVSVVGVGTFGNGIHVKTGTATTALVVEGDGRITGILTVGTSSLKLDGPNNVVNVGTALTLGHSQGVQFHTQNLHSEGFEVNQINASGIITASQFKGDGSQLTGIDATALKDPAGNVKVQAQASGAVHTGIATFQDIDVDGHTNLDNISIAGVTTVANDNYLTFGANATANRNLRIKHNSSNTRNEYRATYQDFFTTDLRIHNISNNAHYAYFWSNQISLFANSSEKLQIVGGGVNILNGNLSVSRDLDVDRHTNLDNVSISGVTTATGNINISSSHPKLLLTDDTNPDFSVHVNASAFHIRNETDNRNDFRITSDGTNELYHGGNLRFETGNTVNINSAHLEITSGQQLRFDNSNNNRTSEILNDGSSGNSVLTFKTNGGNRWSIDSSGHFLPGTAGAVNIGSASAEIGDVYIADDKKLYLGSSQDVEIYHSSGNVTLFNSPTNRQVQLKGDGGLLIRASGNQNIANFVQSGVTLYHSVGNNYTARFVTTSTGITVTGEVAATQDYPLTKPVLDFNFAAEKKLDPRFKFSRASMATFIDKKGIVQYAPDNQPRFDHHPTSGVSLGLLLEREQTNYQEYSALMSEANHKNNITVTDNFTISPDGTQNASKIVNASGSNAQTNIGWNGTSVANNSYGIWSIWVKSEETSCILQFYTNTYIGGAARINIELADGTTGGDAVSSTWRWNVEKYPNKWWRVSWGGNGANAAGGMYIGVVDSKSAARGATCGSATNKTWFAWGVQEEISTQSRIATSYIPTNGYAALRKGDRATMDGDDFDDFFDRFQGTIINEHSNALQSYGGGGSGWEFNNDQFQTNLINQTGSGYAQNSYPGAFASVMGDRGSNGSGNGSGSDYMQAYGPNYAAGLNGPSNDGNGRYPSNNVADYTRYYKTWTDAMSYDVTPSENILRSATGGASSYVGGNTQSISLANISKFEFGNDAGDMGYSSFYGRIKRWVYYDKVLPLTQLETLTAQLPNSHL